MKKCPDCQEIAPFYEGYDDCFCENCNKWLGEKCNDPTCNFCPKRPDRPNVSLAKAKKMPTAFRYIKPGVKSE